jgi:hypothetical protein
MLRRTRTPLQLAVAACAGAVTALVLTSLVGVASGAAPRRGLAGGDSYIRRSAWSPVICWVDGGGELGCWPPALEILDDFPAGDDFATVRVGADHLYAVRDDLTGTCWGWGPCDHGECDDQDGDFVYIREGIDLNCGERTDGEVVCWGLEADLG